MVIIFRVLFEALSDRGGGGGAREAHLLSVQTLSLSCSFGQKICEIIS